MTSRFRRNSPLSSSALHHPPYLVRSVMQEIKTSFFSMALVVDGPAEMETPITMSSVNIPSIHQFATIWTAFYLDLRKQKGAPDRVCSPHPHFAPVQIRQHGESPACPYEFIVRARSIVAHSRRPLTPSCSPDAKASRVDTGHHLRRFHRHPRILRDTIFRRKA